MLKSKTSRWLAGPYLLWMAVFIVVPLFIVIWYALTNSDGQFTLDNLTQIGRYSSVFMRSLILAAVSTAICLVMAFPVGYFLSRLRANKQHIMLMASCCIPVACKPIEIDGVPYYDGALGNTIPLDKAFADGCDKVVLLLTKPAGIIRADGTDRKLARAIRRRYPQAARQLALRAQHYNEGIEKAQRLGADDQTPILIPDDALDYLAQSAGGDMRKALGNLEFAVTAAPVENGTRTIDLSMVQQVAVRTAMRYDKLGDDHYDIVSAYQKSMRGSDPDAALHYLARLLEAGDLPSACRRLMVCACEDVGLAWPQIIPIVKAAVDIANAVGLPEARLPLADAVVLVATAPKSNSAHDGINAAIADIQAGRTGPIPRQLQNKHYDGADAKVKGQHYLYPHDYPNHWTAQQYLPDAIKDRQYYVPGDNKNEQAFAQYWKKIKGEL